MAASMIAAGEAAPLSTRSAGEDTTCSISVVSSDLIAARAHWAASPFPMLWALPHMAATRQRLLDAANALVPGGGAWHLLADAPIARIDGHAVTEGAGAWRFQITLPTTIGTAITALTRKANNPAQGRQERGGWSWTWEAASLEAALGSAVTPSALPPPGHDDLDLSADLPLLFSQGDDLPSAELFTAMGLTRTHYQANFVKDGIGDSLSLPGYHPPLGAISRDDLAGLPAKPWAVLALPVDGERFAALIEQLRAVPEFADLNDWYERGPATTLGPLEHLARALSGTMVVCAVPAAPFPDVALSLPATPATDTLIDAIAQLAKLPAGTARTTAQLIPLPGPWPAGLWLRRASRWALSTSEELANQLATQSGDAPLPHALEAGISSAGLIYVDVPPVMAACSQFTALAMASAPAEKGADAGIARDILLACARSTMPMDALIRLDAQGTAITGHAALVAAMLPVLAIALPMVTVDQSLSAERSATARSQLLAVHARIPASGWPATPPAEATTIPHPARRLAGSAWALYLPPAEDAPGDQLVAISDPRFLGDRCLWLTKDGRVADDRLSNARPLWLAAQRLALRGGVCTADDWSGARKQYRAKRYADAVAVTNAEANYSMFAPKGPWTEIDAKGIGKDWDRVWQQPRANMLFGIIAEQVADEHTTAWLHDVVLERKKTIDPKLIILEDSAITVAGVPARRIRVDTVVNGYHSYFDHTVLAHHGYLYQLVAWCGAQTTTQALAHEAEGLLDRFALIDPARYPDGYEKPASPVAVIESPRMPLSIDLAGLGWTSAPAPKDANVHVELRARHPASKANLFLISADLGGRTNSDHALVHGLLSLMNIDDQAVTEERTLTTPLGATISLRYALGTGDDAFACRAWIARFSGRALLLVVYAPQAEHLPDAIGDAVIEHCAAARNTASAPVHSDPATDADVAASIGAYLTEHKRHQEALPWLQAALAQPHPAIARVQAVLACYCHAEHWQDALSWYEAHAASAADDLGIASFKPWFLVQLGRPAEAIACYRTLFAAGWKDDGDFAAYINALHGVHPDAVEAAFAASPVPAHSSEGYRLHARILVQDGKAAEAQRLLEGALTALPDDIAIAAGLADQLIDQKKPGEAREFLAGFIAHHPRSAWLWHLAGVADYRTDRFREAITDFKTELDINPTATGAHEFLDAIDRRLGKGDTSRIANLIAPVPGIGELVPPSAPSLPGGAFALRATAIIWSTTAGFLRSDRQVISIPDRGACETFNTQRFTFDPAIEELSINHIIVRDSAGALVSESRIEECYVLDDHEDGIASTRKVVSVPISGLRPGCTLDCLVTRRQSQATTAAPFTTVDLAGRYPTQLAQLIVQAPAGSMVAFAGGDLHLQRDGDRLVVRAQGLPGRHWEPLAPGTRTDEQIVWIGPSGRTWAQEGKDYLGELAALLVDSPAVTAQALSAIRGLGTPEARIAALADLVQSRTSYTAVEFGRRGLMPQAAALTLERRLGDCKDHALLLQRLLTAAGITAHLALVPRDETLFADMPDLDQFNHMVVVVPGDRGQLRVLDATAKEHDLSLVPSAVAERQLLLLDPAGPRLVRAPPIGNSHIAIERTWLIDRSGQVSAQERVSMTGYWASSWRNRLIGKQADDWRRELRDELGSAVSAVTSVEVAALDETRQPLLITLAYALRYHLSVHGSQITGQLPEPWFSSLWDWSVQRGESRQRALVLRFPLTLDIATRLSPPSGLVAAEPAPIAEDADDFFIIHHAPAGGAPVAGQSVTGVRSLSIQQLVGTFTPARYAAWCDRVDALGRRVIEDVTLAPAGTK
jgi:tetratricopeptide (TPR) repeat protein